MTTTENRPVMSTDEVRALLTTFRPGPAPAPSTVAAWRQALAGCSFGACQAALIAFGPTKARHATPAEIVAAIDAAQTAKGARAAEVIPFPRGRVRPSKPTPQVDFAEAGARGIERVYTAMGWQRHSERAFAQRVPCPFCRATTGTACRPLTRNRVGRTERRDRDSLTHPSRVERARAELGEPPQ
jgi:hypothetical protein